MITRSRRDKMVKVKVNKTMSTIFANETTKRAATKKLVNVFRYF